MSVPLRLVPRAAPQLKLAADVLFAEALTGLAELGLTGLIDKGLDGLAKRVAIQYLKEEKEGNQ